MTTLVNNDSKALVWWEDPTTKVKAHAKMPGDITTVMKCIDVFNKHTSLIKFSFEPLKEDWEKENRFQAQKTTASTRSYQDILNGEKARTFTWEGTEEALVPYLVDVACASLYREAKEKSKDPKETKLKPPFADSPVLSIEYLKEHFNITRDALDNKYLPSVKFIKEKDIDVDRLSAIAEHLKEQNFEEDQLACFSSYIALVAPQLHTSLIAHKIEGKELPSSCSIS